MEGEEVGGDLSLVEKYITPSGVQTSAPGDSKRAERERSGGAVPLKGLASFQGDHQVPLTREEGRLPASRTFLPVASSDCALSEALNGTSGIPHSKQGDCAGDSCRAGCGA